MANRATLEGTVFQPETRYSATTGKPILNFNLSYYDGKDQNKKRNTQISASSRLALWLRMWPSSFKKGTTTS